MNITIASRSIFSRRALRKSEILLFGMWDHQKPENTPENRRPKSGNAYESACIKSTGVEPHFFARAISRTFELISHATTERTDEANVSVQYAVPHDTSSTSRSLNAAPTMARNRRRSTCRSGFA